MSYHDSWPYFYRAFGPQELGVIEDRPGVPGAPQHLAALVRQMRERHVKVVLVESWYPTLAGIGFTSATDYRLSSSSPFKGRGSGGTDPGANIDELSRRTAGSKVGM